MKKAFGLAATALTVASLVAPVAVNAADFSAVIVTDVGGVDDKSFNQSAWEGLEQFGKDNKLEKGVGGYDYLQSNSDSDYVTNLNSAVQANFSLIFGIGYKLEAADKEAATQYPDKHFAIVDSVVDLPNVASLTFKDNEAAFLAGVAAAKTTKTKQVGFIGGVEGFVIDRFEAGFVEGVKAVDPSIKVEVQYAGSFADAAKGKQLAAAMYSGGADVIFHASGGTGNGVFSEAKDIVTNDPKREVYVIGVDLDQDAEGLVTVDGKERHLTLASTLKGVGSAVKKFAQETKEGQFKSGNTIYGLKDGGVDLTTAQLSPEAKKAVEEYKAKIVKGEITVPEKPNR